LSVYWSYFWVELNCSKTGAGVRPCWLAAVVCMLLTWKPFIFYIKKNIEWGYPSWDTFYKFLTQHMKKLKLRHVVFYGSLWSTCMLSSVKNIHMLQLCLSLCTCSVTHLYMFNSWKFSSSLFFGCEFWTYWN
jgi:hypothetical protein